mmetsp:Transcript_17859/g.62682  ORF Transcript_17859/g.62682 Transcript_17859/m.62682 type:complete len:185 (+) Transcript_17859:283-837(+)
MSGCVGATAGPHEQGGGHFPGARLRADGSADVGVDIHLVEGEVSPSVEVDVGDQMDIRLNDLEATKVIIGGLFMSIESVLTDFVVLAGDVGDDSSDEAPSFETEFALMLLQLVHYFLHSGSGTPWLRGDMVAELVAHIFGWSREALVEETQFVGDRTLIVSVLEAAFLIVRRSAAWAMMHELET